MIEEEFGEVGVGLRQVKRLGLALIVPTFALVVEKVVFRVVEVARIRATTSFMSIFCN